MATGNGYCSDSLVSTTVHIVKNVVPKASLENHATKDYQPGVYDLEYMVEFICELKMSQNKIMHTKRNSVIGFIKKSLERRNIAWII